MRVVFLGTPRVATVSLAALLDAGHDIPLAVTRPDRPVGRSRRPVAPPVKLLAAERGIEVIQPLRVRTRALRERLEAVGPDALVVVAYGRILPAGLLDLAPHGSLNLHFSLLPAYRGAAPVQWALARGERVTGVTTMRMNERMDEGDLLLQRQVAIEPAEHAPALGDRLACHGADLLVETLDRLAAGTVEPRPQDHAQASYAPPLRPTDGEASPSLDATELADRVRGFDPWPGVWLRRGGRRIRLLEVRAVERDVPEVAPAGTLTELDAAGPLLACGNGSRLALVRVQPDGGRAMTGHDAIHGRRLRLGERLEGVAASD